MQVRSSSFQDTPFRLATPHVFVSSIPNSWYPRLGIDLEQNLAYAKDSSGHREVLVVLPYKSYNFRFLCPLPPREVE